MRLASVASSSMRRERLSGTRCGLSNLPKQQVAWFGSTRTARIAIERADL